MRLHGTGTRRFRHHVVGELTLAYETMALNAEAAAPTAQSLTLVDTPFWRRRRPQCRRYSH